MNSDPDAALEPVATAEAEAHHAQRELLQAATQALVTLSEMDRQTLLATFWEEGTTVRGATLRKRRERALTRLRGALKRLYGLG